MLLRRPDVAEAEAKLASQEFSVLQARAAFFPSITLTGQYGVQSTLIKYLATPQAIGWQVAANAAQPLFDGYNLQGQYKLQKGKYAELAADYRKQIADRPVRHGKRADRRIARRGGNCKLQADAVAAAQRALTAAEGPAARGHDRHRDAVDDGNRLFPDAGQLEQVRLAHFEAATSLYQALGGGWSPTTRDVEIARPTQPIESRQGPLGHESAPTGADIRWRLARSSWRSPLRWAWQSGFRFGGGDKPACGRRCRSGPTASAPRRGREPSRPRGSRDVPVTIDAVGTVQALNTVTIRTQVDGRLLKLAFTEGAGREEGRRARAEIDPLSIQAQYDQAVAKKAQDEANLANARVDLVRYQKLVRRQFRLAAAISTRKKRWSRSSRRRCAPIRPRSTTPRPRSTMRRSARRSTGAPASGSSTSAIFCTPPI